MKTWMSGICEPVKRGTTSTSYAVVQWSRTRPRGRAAFLLALVWVVVGSLLYAAEVLRLVTGLG